MTYINQLSYLLGVKYGHYHHEPGSVVAKGKEAWNCICYPSSQF
jgi:hypothetical protein